MEDVEQQLERLAGGGSGGALPEPVVEGGEGGLDGGAEDGDLVAELEERRAHAGDGGVNVDELGGEADEVGVVAVDEINEVAVEGGEMGAEVGSEGVERDEGAQVGDVGIGVEVGVEEGRRLEPQRLGVAEQLHRGAWCWVQIRHGRCRRGRRRRDRRSCSDLARRL